MHPAGKFKATVIDHGMNTAKTGTQQIVIGFETEEGRITGFFSLSPKSAEYSVKKLRAAGFKGDNFEELNETPGFRGSTCWIDVTHETNPSGQVQAKVGWVNDTESNVKMDPLAAKVAAKKYNALLKANPPKSDGEQPWDR